MMEIMIKEILEKYDVQDENLAKALAEIYELFLAQVDTDLAEKMLRSARIQGIKF